MANLEAGRELDALVAKMMGFKAWRETRGEYALAVMQRPGAREPWMSSRDSEREKSRYVAISCAEAVRSGFFGVGFPAFSTDIAAAWTVLEHIQDLFAGELQFNLVNRSGYDGPRYLAGFKHYRDGWQWSTVFGQHQGDTAPLAICRAALSAQGGER